MYVCICMYVALFNMCCTSTILTSSALCFELDYQTHYLSLNSVENSGRAVCVTLCVCFFAKIIFESTHSSEMHTTHGVPPL